MRFSQKQLRVAALGLSLLVPRAERLLAQQADSVRSRFLFDIPPVGSKTVRSWPAMNIQTPSGYGARWGDWFVGVGYQKRTRYTTTQDGIAGGGLGAWQPVRIRRVRSGRGVGVHCLSTISKEYPGRISSSITFFPGPSELRWAGTTLIIRRESTPKARCTLSRNKTFFTRRSSKEWFSSVTVSLGLGNGRFRPETDTTLAPGSPNVFGDIGIRIAEPTPVSIGDWNGQDLTLGMSFVPFARLPFVVTPGITDFTHHAGDGRRFMSGPALASALHAELPSNFRGDMFMTRRFT